MNSGIIWMGGTTIRASNPVLARLKERQAEYTEESGRAVSMAETLERILNERDELAAAVARHYEEPDR